MKVILNNIRSCHNVGSIFRTADACGVSEIFLVGYSPLPIDKYKNPNKAMLKVSLGSEKAVKWKKIYGVGKLIKDLKAEGYLIVALELTPTAKNYFDLKLSSSEFEKAVLIVGNEKRGISKQVLSLADEVIQIPMDGIKESLNVSVAFGIVSFALRDSSLKS
jgi:23S rRNA (guanosine2251-2'-O)-methyltransferase